MLGKYETILNTFPEYRVLKSLMLYVPPVLIVLGTFGNVFSFIILRRRAMVKVSSYHYLATLAVADSLVLYIGLLRLWLIEVTGYDFHNSTDWVCKLTISFGYMASDLSVWLIIAVTVERYIVVCFPLKASTMINTNRAKKVIAFLVLLMFTINLHFFWTVEIVEQPVEGTNMNVTKCEAPPQYQHLVNEVWPWVDACIYSFVPFIVILVLNILIVIEVIEARAHRLRLQNTSEHHYHRQMSRFRMSGANGKNFPPPVDIRTCRRACGPGEGMKLTIMLLTVSFAFLLTTLPTNITIIISGFWQHGNLRRTLQFKLAKTVAELLMYVNHSINFCLYCATGQKFRQQIVYLLRCRKDNYAAWNSLHTDDSKLTSSLRNGNHSIKLLAHAVPELTFNHNGDIVLPPATKL